MLLQSVDFWSPVLGFHEGNVSCNGCFSLSCILKEMQQKLMKYSQNFVSGIFAADQPV